MGLVLVIAAVIMQGAVQGLMSGEINTGDSLAFSTFAFASAAAFFGVVNRIRRGHRRLTRRERELMLLMNVLTAITFLGFYLSLSLIPAATAGALETSVGPLSVLVLASLGAVRRPSGSFGVRWTFAAVLCCVAALLALHSWDGGRAATPLTAVSGIVMALCAGIGMGAITVLSRRFGDMGTSPITVTAHRFHLTYGSAAILLLFRWQGSDALSTPVGIIAVYGVMAVVIPLYLLQVGMQKANPLAAMAVVVTLPSITYLVEWSHSGGFDVTVFVLIGTIIAVSFAYACYDRTRKKVSISSKNSSSGAVPESFPGRANLYDESR